MLYNIQLNTVKSGCTVHMVVQCTWSFSAHGRSVHMVVHCILALRRIPLSCSKPIVVRCVIQGLYRKTLLP